MDIQIILIFILALLTVNLIIVGIYVVLVLKEFRETIKKANAVLGGVESFTRTLANPVSLLSGFAGALLSGIKAVKSIKTLRGTEEEE